MLETNAIQLLQAVEANAAQTRTTNAPNTAKEFEAMLIETVLRQGGLLQAFEGSDGGGAQALMGEWLLPMLARQLAEQVQLGLGEMMMKSASVTAGEK
jgi:Rod binding domain-containing protein